MEAACQWLSAVLGVLAAALAAAFLAAFPVGAAVAVPWSTL
jgi:hypothetical protein